MKNPVAQFDNFFSKKICRHQPNEKYENGNQKTVTVPKRVKEWFYCVSDKWYFEVRYGNRLLELAAGKPVIEVPKKERLVGVIETVIKATESGELDGLLNSIKRKSRVVAAAVESEETTK
ncbi:MAG: hypothetical protein IIA62_00280 [Nitrospinae bacterium]|nr:hypothetical protein [Nitrospinota bacterium]